MTSFNLRSNLFKKFLLIILPLLFYWKSFFVFYTHDDFFHFSISKANNLKEFLNFFNIFNSTGWEYYRPLSTQVFYFIGKNIFRLNPIPMHIIVFFLFVLTIFLIYKIVNILTKSENIAFWTSMFYATTSSHFGSLYFLATQEMFVTTFVFLSLYLFLLFRRTKNAFQYFLSVFAFICALLSKENAVIYPALLILTWLYIDNFKLDKKKIYQYLKLLLPFILLSVGYLATKYFFTNFGRSDSYTLSFNPKLVFNNYFWYGLWSLNIPEMFLDYIGPGLRINMRLFLSNKTLIVLIFSNFALFISLLAGYLIKHGKVLMSKKSNIILFSFLWFIFSLLPFVFLFFHKFPFYLSLPLFGVVLFITVLVNNQGSKIKYLIFTLWLVGSILNLTLTEKTSWITQGANTSQKIYTYLKGIRDIKNKTIVFYDTIEDESVAPWYPSESIKTTLSGSHFFEVFYPNTKVTYLRVKPLKPEANFILLPARSFLSY